MVRSLSMALWFRNRQRSAEGVAVMPYDAGMLNDCGVLNECGVRFRFGDYQPVTTG